MKSIKLSELLFSVSKHIPNHEKVNTEVSKVTIGWHIEHVFLVVEKVTESIKVADPEKYKRKFNLLRSVVFALKKIPRGKGKSPKAVLPKTYDSGILTTHFTKVKSTLKDLETIPEENYFKHPVFGHLKLLKTITFLELHTKHHLKIIEDILS